MKVKHYAFRARLWKYEGTAAWHFVTLPKTLTTRIRQTHGPNEEGWGRLKVSAQVKEQKWDTAIWYDSRAESYLLPIKSAFRKTLKLSVGQNIKVSIAATLPDPKMLKILEHQAVRATYRYKK